MAEIKLTDAQIKHLLPKAVDLDTFLADIEGKDDKEASTAFLEHLTSKFREVAEQREKAGISKKAKDIEKAFRPLIEKYGIDSAEKTEEQIRLLTEALEVEPAKAGGTLTKEELLKLPDVKAIVAERLNAANQAYQAEKATLENKLKEQGQADIESKALAAIAEHFTDKKAVLGQATPQAAAALALKNIGIENVGKVKGPDGKDILVLVDADGAPLTTDWGAQIPLTEKVESTWVLGYNKADPTKQGGGAPSPGGNAGNTGSSVTITSKEQASEMLRDEVDPKKRAEIYAALSDL